MNAKQMEKKNNRTSVTVMLGLKMSSKILCCSSCIQVKTFSQQLISNHKLPTQHLLADALKIFVVS